MLAQLFVSVLVLCYMAPSGAADLLREQQIATRVEAVVQVGDALRLVSGDRDFLAIHTPARRSPNGGGVILLHDRGMHPDWPGVVRPLRSGLPEHGWETLALQMPLAAPDSPHWGDVLLIQEAAPRIAAGAAFLRQRGIDRIALVGHGLGASMAIAYLQGGDAADIRALVAVGLSLQSGASGDAAVSTLRELSIPLLDIYGSRDSDAVLASAQVRAAAIGAARDGRYRQDRVTGADHFFHGFDSALLARIRSWLARYAGD